MAKKTKTHFICQACGHSSPQWVGKCPACQQWNTVVEEILHDTKPDRGGGKTGTSRSAISLSAIDGGEISRIAVGIDELDRVLGGGIATGSVILVGGDPGVGKTTLLMQTIDRLSRNGVEILYVSGEESGAQLKLRADRLSLNLEMFISLFSTDLSEILATIAERTPRVLVIDSVQTMSTDEIESAPGSISQLRAVSHELTRTAKEQNISIFLVGHITKEGTIAGPKALEHLVDTVLYFEGGGNTPYRLLKTHKNRFGPTDEVGVFEMKNDGLAEVPNPSQSFLSERMESEPGSAVFCALEGTRSLLVEIQCLATPSPLAIPRRVSVGIDHNRVNIIAAVLEKKGGINLSQHDLFINVAGGLRVTEPAADLAFCAAAASSYLDIPIPPGVFLFGEIGLAGEIRGVSHTLQRTNEAKKLNFKMAVIPQRNAQELSESKTDTIAVRGVKTVRELIDTLFQDKGK
jgi:DNA repair protein RadA/Sms